MTGTGARRRVVFIAGLGRSGSTLLDLILSGHPRCTGVGEAVRSIRGGGRGVAMSRTLTCSCGRLMPECRYWSEVLPHVSDDPAASEPSIGRRYEIVLDAFDRVFGPDEIMVDAAKHIELLAGMRGLDAVDLRVIHLVKDVRAFTISQIDNARRRGYGPLRRSPSFLFWRWYRRNRVIEAFLDRHEIPTMRLGYETLCLDTERAVAGVCDFIGVSPSPAMLAPDGTGRHALRGNRPAIERLRAASDHERRIVYDDRWFSRRDWQVPALLYRPVMSYNAAVHARAA